MDTRKIYSNALTGGGILGRSIAVDFKNQRFFEKPHCEFPYSRMDLPAKARSIIALNKFMQEKDPRYTIDIIDYAMDLPRPIESFGWSNPVFVAQETFLVSAAEAQFSDDPYKQKNFLRSAAEIVFKDQYDFMYEFRARNLTPKKFIIKINNF